MFNDIFGNTYRNRFRDIFGVLLEIYGNIFVDILSDRFGDLEVYWKTYLVICVHTYLENMELVTNWIACSAV